MREALEGQPEGWPSFNRSTRETLARHSVVVDNLESKEVQNEATQKGLTIGEASTHDRTQYKLNGSVPLPYDIAFSFVLQSVPGERRFSNYSVVRQQAFVEEQLGHDLQNLSLSVPLFPSGIGFFNGRGGLLTTSQYVDNSVQYEPQVNQLDLRLTKILRFGGGLIRANFDLFNVFNANAVTRVLDSYTNPGVFPSVAGIMNGRLFKFGATISF